MSAKYLIFGATGSIGSNLADKLYNSNHDFHLVSRNEKELKSLSEKLKCTYTVADVLEDNFIENVKNEISKLFNLEYEDWPKDVINKPPSKYYKGID